MLGDDDRDDYRDDDIDDDRAHLQLIHYPYS